ncbi:UvrD-helicase domain-containing protein [Candidatus Sumerlaeota bacterium]|nr:UvrD-helicase domain-containing protein [Candidatus Sumerlaeota bacterium]
MNDWLDILNPPQREAVTHVDGPALVIAGAGSGKTRVITYRVAYLVRECGVAPWNILAVTFTNKAAEEMRERVARLIGEKTPGRLSISTFHSTCAGVLRREATRVGLTANFTICDEHDQHAVVKTVVRELGIDDKEIKPRQAQWIINQAKMRMLGPSDVGRILQSKHEQEYVRIFEAYNKVMARSDACDFEDLILKCVELFQGNDEARQEWAARWPYIMVDEYQDTNFVQYQLLAALAREHRNLCVVGDEDQSIYSWRGAEISNLLDFRENFPEARLIRLEQNYRSHGNILSAASHVIERNRERLGKTLWTERPDGPPLYLIRARTDRDEAGEVVSRIQELHDSHGLPYHEIAVFFRANALSRVVEDRMREWSVPYRMIGGIRFYDRMEIKDLLSYMKLAANPNNDISMLRVINTPRRGIGQKSIDAVLEEAGAKNQTMFVTLKQMAAENRLPRGGKKSVAEFLGLLETWRADVGKLSPSTLLERILSDTGYIEALGDENAIEVVTRRENIDELKASIVQWEKEYLNATLDDYLEMVSLTSATDDFDQKAGAVSLMTVHAAKGLEFSCVFLMGMDNEIFPNRRSIEEGSLEEERRLFYVALTRAKDMCVLSRADSRFYNGRQSWNQPSMFLRELPREKIEDVDEMDYNAVSDFCAVRRQLREDVVREAVGDDEDLLIGGMKSAEREAQRRLDERIIDARRRARQRRDEEKTAGTDELRPGVRVRHPLLGVGEILSAENAGDDRKLSVLFEDGSEETLYARFARLKVIEA